MSLPELSQYACAYARYDPETLEPTNEETRIRLAELGWTEADFRGRSVLDIGFNSGLLTIEACRLGARRVVACESGADHVAAFAPVVAAHRLPVEVRHRAFGDIDPDADGADVVLAMEVLHWIVAQGMRLEEALERLVALTRETLFVEFPWSVDEPSIRVHTRLGERDYSADRILDLLTQRFRRVCIVRFLGYFGPSPEPARVLRLFGRARFSRFFGRRTLSRRVLVRAGDRLPT